jgi:hypothetical protein
MARTWRWGLASTPTSPKQVPVRRLAGRSGVVRGGEEIPREEKKENINFSLTGSVEYQVLSFVCQVFFFYAYLRELCMRLCHTD